MGGTSSLDLVTTRFESGMQRPVLQSASLWRRTLWVCCPWPTLPMGSTLFPGLMTALSACGSHFHVNHPPFVIQFAHNFFLSLTHRVGSEIQTAGYSIGYPLIVVVASIHPLSLRFLLHLIFGQFLLILRTLLLEPLGPKFSTVHGASRSFLVTFVLI